MLGWLPPADYVLDLTLMQFVVGLILTFVACTLIAWLAVRYDWGKKSRY
jgi:hypothetical protein